MASATTPRTEWIHAGLRALAAGGPDAVRIEAIARALGVTKGGFYGYFADRDALLTEMLDTWEREVTEAIIDSVDAEGGDGRERLRNLFRVVGNRPRASTEVGTELAIREWARRDPAVAHRLRRVDERQMGYLRGLFREFCPDEVEVEARCVIVVSMRVAAHLVTFDHGTRMHEDVMERVRRRVLE
ncbi:TetR/AcrR family transcriptional regulator [Streptomyces sp. NPDC050504]|uniref:TetR/AcrR family transcriptional regulator n=1 Tax=Streptomyces sp. NPDC050504 TaxID=3365618 RepID=UPI00378F6E8E